MLKPAKIGGGRILPTNTHVSHILYRDDRTS